MPNQMHVCYFYTRKSMTLAGNAPAFEDYESPVLLLNYSVVMLDGNAPSFPDSESEVFTFTL